MTIRHPLPLRWTIAASVVAGLSLAPASLRAQANREAARTARDSVVAVVQEFFRTMEVNDVEGARRIMRADGMALATRRVGDSVVVAGRGNQSHFERLRAARDTVLERMWDPTVQVHETVAMLWTPYDLYVNGKFSHCGIDVFTLVRERDGWKIASVAYTVEPTGCTPSPLGPPIRR